MSNASLNRIKGCFFVLLGSLVLWNAGTANLQAANRHVVLITIDGFPASLFWNTNTPIPRLRQLAAEGVAGEGMLPINPTVTWPNHTAIDTGVRADRHGVLFNGILKRGLPGEPVKVDPYVDKVELVAVPTLYDLLKEKGFRTASIDWPCTRNAATIDLDFPDTPDNVKYTSPAFRRELVARGILADETDASFDALSGPGRDEAWTQAACYAIRQYKPQFLQLHLLNTDSTHHRYGPGTPASLTALALADTKVGQVLDALKSAGIHRRTSVLVVSDHGFAAATNLLNPNVLLRRAGLLEADAKGKILKAKVQVIPEGGSGFVYLTDPATQAEDLKKVRELFQKQEGIAEIVEPSQYAQYGFPSVQTNPGMGDLVVGAQDGYGISGSAAGDEVVVPIKGNVSIGYHGYLATNPKMKALFIASGQGIKRGEKIGMVKNIDIAPTIAHLLKQPMPDTDGKILFEILNSEK
jgi:predicted AlkP superfamily pyrophosphatase or phosphodiesterase